MYVNELKVDPAKRLSDRIEKATQFKLYSHNTDSENYQVSSYKTFYIQKLRLFIIT
jgi:hypothetical protein